MLLSSASSLRTSEIQHFSDLSQEWWDEKGAFSILHQINPLRLRFVRDQTVAHFEELSQNSPRTPLKGLRFLDVGCGGGLLSEPLCRMGADVVGLDAAQPNIEVAQAHAAHEKLSIRYETATVEAFQEIGEAFDVLTALEIVEHVKDPFAFMAACATLVKPGGMIFFSTLNRTFLSYLLGIVAAESLLGWVPKGTHHWDQFIKPAEMEWALKRNGFSDLCFRGMTYRPLTQQWSLGPNQNINYLVSGVKL